MTARMENRPKVPNRQEYGELREMYRAQLLRSVDITEGLLSDLAAIKTLKIKVSNIRKAADTQAKAEMILSLPPGKNYEQNIGPFLRALRENGHAHVADVFTTGSGEDLMTDDTHKLLNSKLDDLCNYLDPECSIISMLRSKDVLTESDEGRVMVHKTANGQVDQIIKILSRKSNSSYQYFIDSLKEKDQEHIVYILTGGKEGSPPISKEKLKLIRIQRQQLVRKWMESRYNSFVSALVSCEVFTDFDRQRVEEKTVHHERNEQILNILVRKSNRHFENFIKALHQSDQKHVADLLDDLTISGTVSVNATCMPLSEQQSAETKLSTELEKDLKDEDSETSRNLDDLGIHEAGVSSKCIAIWFKFSTRETLDVMQSDKLSNLFTERYCRLFSGKRVPIHVKIAEKEFKRCSQLLDERKAPMRPEHHEALKIAAKQIVDDIIVDEVLGDLSICQYRKAAILSQSSSPEKARVLLKVMARRPDCEFHQLLSALRRSKQDIAVNFITG